MFSKRMMEKLLILLTVFLLHQGAKICPAQEMPTCELGEIVITATRTEKELKSAPGSVFVVSKKDVEKRNNLTVEAALNTVPGFFSRREKGIVGLVPVFSLHGIAGTNRTLILMDGTTSKTDITYQSSGKDRTYSMFCQNEILILNNLTTYIGFRHDIYQNNYIYLSRARKCGQGKKQRRRI